MWLAVYVLTDVFQGEINWLGDLADGEKNG